MQAAARRAGGAQKLHRSDRLKAIPHIAAADDAGLLAALPIAAAIFTLNDGKLWVEAMNPRFLELSGCNGDPEVFVQTFKRYAEGEGGAFIKAFLADTV